MTNARNGQLDSFIQDAYRTLLQSVRELDTSPYKPFGTYMFCSSHGAAYIAKLEIVLAMLHLTMQSQETYSNNIAHDCLLEQNTCFSFRLNLAHPKICQRKRIIGVFA